MTSNGTYNHRNHTSSRQQSLQRFSDALDVLKQEFEVISSERDSLRAQKEEHESQITLQVNEVNTIRRSLLDLETQQIRVRQHYEEELRRLRSELNALRPSPHLSGIPGFKSHANTPRLGPTPVAAPISQAGAGSTTSDSFGRDRVASSAGYDRERGKERIRVPTPPEKDGLNSDNWEMRPQQKARELRERDRENDRMVDLRDAKRLKADNDSSDSAKLPPAHALYPPRHPHAQGGSTGERDYQVTLPPINGAGSALLQQPYRSPRQHQLSIAEAQELSLHTVPPEYKKEGSDWYAVFNPRVKRTLDISPVHTLTHSSVVCCVQFSLDGKYLATGCNRTAQIYDVKTGQKVCVLVDDSAGMTGDLYIRSVRFSPDGKLLATGAEDRQIRIWDIAKKRIRHIFDGHQQEIYSLDFSLDGRFIVSGSGDRTARVWDMSDYSSGSSPSRPSSSTAPKGSLTKVLTIPSSPPLSNTVSIPPSSTPTTHVNTATVLNAGSTTDSGITSVAISPDSRYVAAGSLDTIVRVWDVVTGQLVEQLHGHKDSVYSVAFTPDGRGLVTGSLDRTLKGWDVSAVVAGGTKGKGPGVESKMGMSPCTTDFIGHKDYVLSVALSADAQWVVSGSKDRLVHFWDVRSGALQFMLQGHKNSVISLDLNPTSGILATGSGDNMARIWRYNQI